MKLNLCKLATVVAVTGLSAASFAGGFEKGTFWGAREAGMANAVVSTVSGSEALYFNPSALAGRQGWDASLHLSPTFAKFHGPWLATKEVDGSQTMSPISGAFLSYGLDSNLSVGAGVYVGAGTRSEFKAVDFSSASPFLDQLKPDLFADVKVIEYSVGVGYRVAPGVKVGAAYRVSSVKASLATAIKPSTATGGNLVYASLNDLSTTSWSGFRLGVSYLPEGASWGLGASLRSAVGFTAKADSFTGALESATSLAGTKTDLTGGATSISNTFPLALELGGHYQISPEWLVAIGYNWAKYSTNKQIDATGILSLGTTAVADLSAAPIAQSWFDQHTLRFGTEYKPADTWSVRGGYLIASQVVPKWTARPTFSSPGVGQEVDVGVGKTFLANTVDTGLGIGYGWAKGTVDGQGEFSSHSLNTHMSVAYAF